MCAIGPGPLPYPSAAEAVRPAHALSATLGSVAKVPTRTRAELRRRIDDELLNFLDTERAALEPEAHPLLDELVALITSGGKRLRPRFCYWGHIAGGGDDAAAIHRAAAAFELLHTFALIHDDVMDRSPLRRSRHSTFRALAELARAVPHRGDPDRFGVSAALLTGLLGMVLCDRLFQTAGFEADVMELATARFDRMRTRAIAGQYLDLLASHRGEADEDTARRIGRLKSGGYSVTDPLVCGALLAEATADAVEVLAAYGEPLGEAFQIADDLLGTFGDPAVTGKDRDGDLREGKQTVLLTKARELAGPSDRRFLDEKIGDPGLQPGDADGVREIFGSSGALDATRASVERLYEAALAALDPSVIGAEADAALREMAAEATRRDA